MILLELRAFSEHRDDRRGGDHQSLEKEGRDKRAVKTVVEFLGDVVP